MIITIMIITTQECLVVLPALPMESTRFPEPLRSFAIMLGDAFDREKAGERERG